jgi:uncharacterized protein (TIGR03083 family)
MRRAVSLWQAASVVTMGSADEEVLGLYREGVRALARQAEAVDWDAPACGSWTAAELVRHVASVARWYHDWLDRALAGDADPPFPPTEFPGRNDADVHARSDQDPADALVEFVESADGYAVRLPEHWDLAYGYPGGRVTAGLHAGAATAEWHLHAWDLAGAAGREHRPSDPGTVFRSVGRCVATARGGLTGAGQGVLVRVGANVRPWEQLLRASGRRDRKGTEHEPGRG